MSAKLLDGRLVDWMGEGFGFLVGFLDMNGYEGFGFLDMNGFLVGLADGQING